MASGKMVRVSSKGQIVLPKRFRDRLGIRDGDYILVEELEDGILLLEKPIKGSLSEIAAALREEARSRDFNREDLNRAIKRVRKAKGQ